MKAQKKSRYHITCICGHPVRVHAATFQCDQCGRQGEIRFREPAEEKERKGAHAAGDVAK